MTERDEDDDKPKRKPSRVGKWVATQAHNVDPVRREAAEHICSRWDTYSGWFDLAKVLRTLIREDSEFAAGARLLATDYVEQFASPGKDGDAEGTDKVRGLTLAGPLVPIDVVRCAHTWLVADATHRCRRDAVPGSDRCGRHGGQYMSAEDARRISEHTSSRILDATDRAVRTLIELMDEGRSEMVRLQAATSILDRAGIGPTQRIEVSTAEAGDNAAAELRARLARMRETMEQAPALEAIANADPDAEVTEAEIVE